MTTATTATDLTTGTTGTGTTPTPTPADTTTGTTTIDTTTGTTTIDTTTGTTTIDTTTGTTNIDTTTGTTTIDTTTGTTTADTTTGTTTADTTTGKTTADTTTGTTTADTTAGTAPADTTTGTTPADTTTGTTPADTTTGTTTSDTTTGTTTSGTTTGTTTSGTTTGTTTSGTTTRTKPADTTTGTTTADATTGTTPGDTTTGTTPADTTTGTTTSGTTTGTTTSGTTTETTTSGATTGTTSSGTTTGTTTSGTTTGTTTSGTTETTTSATTTGTTTSDTTTGTTISGTTTGTTTSGTTTGTTTSGPTTGTTTSGTTTKSTTADATTGTTTSGTTTGTTISGTKTGTTTSGTTTGTTTTGTTTADTTTGTTPADTITGTTTAGMTTATTATDLTTGTTGTGTTPTPTPADTTTGTTTIDTTTGTTTSGTTTGTTTSGATTGTTSSGTTTGTTTSGTTTGTTTSGTTETTTSATTTGTTTSDTTTGTTISGTTTGTTTSGTTTGTTTSGPTTGTTTSGTTTKSTTADATTGTTTSGTTTGTTISGTKTGTTTTGTTTGTTTTGTTTADTTTGTTPADTITGIITADTTTETTTTDTTTGTTTRDTTQGTIGTTTIDTTTGTTTIDTTTGTTTSGTTTGTTTRGTTTGTTTSGTTTGTTTSDTTTGTTTTDTTTGTTTRGTTTETIRTTTIDTKTGTPTSGTTTGTTTSGTTIGTTFRGTTTGITTSGTTTGTTTSGTTIGTTFRGTTTGTTTSGTTTGTTFRGTTTGITTSDTTTGTTIADTTTGTTPADTTIGTTPADTTTGTTTTETTTEATTRGTTTGTIGTTTIDTTTGTTTIDTTTGTTTRGTTTGTTTSDTTTGATTRGTTTGTTTSGTTPGTTTSGTTTGTTARGTATGTTTRGTTTGTTSTDTTTGTTTSETATGTTTFDTITGTTSDTTTGTTTSETSAGPTSTDATTGPATTESTIGSAATDLSTGSPTRDASTASTAPDTSAESTTADATMSSSVPQAVAILKEVCVEIKLTSEAWSRDFLTNTSFAFTDLGKKIESGVHSGLQSVRGYLSTRVRSYRAGSVFADIVVTSNQSLFNASDLRTQLYSVVNNGTIGNLPVNDSYLQFYDGGVYIADVSVDYSSQGKVNDTGLHVIVTGYNVTATCSARTPGASDPKFDWTLGGRNVTSMQSSARYVISPRRRSDTDPFQFVSSVTIIGILITEGGQLVCKVTAEDKTDSKQVALKVVRKLYAILTPPTFFVMKGKDVPLTCSRRAGYDILWIATLFRVDGSGEVQLVAGLNQTEKEKQANFTIQGVTSDVRYRCEITDRIETISSNEAIITALSQPAKKKCLLDGVWGSPPADSHVRLVCPQGYSAEGFQSRTCGPDGQWQVPDTSQCVRQKLEDLKTTVDQIVDGTTTSTTKYVVEKLQNSTSCHLLSGDVTAAIDILDKVANFTVDTKKVPGEDELEKFVLSADNVLHAPRDVWQDQTSKALSLVNAVDRMGKASSRTFNSSVLQRPPIKSKKIVLQVGRSNGSDIMFPIPNQPQNYYPEWVTAAKNSAFLSKEAFDQNVGEVRYSAVIYTNLSNVFSGQLDRNLTGQSKLSINSPILALSLELDDVTISTPVRLTFDHITSHFSQTSCQFLNVEASTGGIWSSNGCRVTESNSTMTVCECDHLTNFAVLMSPYKPAKTVADVLNIFSIVGCSISIFCLILTLTIYFILWRHVKSDRSVLLVHLCVVLVIAYVTFLAGVNRIEHKIVCTVVAAFLHYLWLVVFFLMLCEGIDIFITVVIVFPTESVIGWLLLMAYGVPVLIVGVTMGVTNLEGYGGTDFCWLSPEDGLLWTFVGPALAALMVNFVFVVFVIRALLSVKVMIRKDKREQTKSVVKAICVMTPILGLSWIFGAMSVNDDTMVFQILFVVFNSLQGLMIFVLHCLLSKQVREGMQDKQRRYYLSTRFGTQKRSSESNTSSNDLDKQMNGRVRKKDPNMAKLDGPSLMTSNDTPKVMALKNPVARVTHTQPAEKPTRTVQLNTSTAYDLDYAQPRLSLTDRWFSLEQSIRPQQQQRCGQQHPPVRHPPQPAPFQQPRLFPRLRLATSAASSGSPHYHPFAAPK
ncbi:mucin-22-like isoform X2 [Littorina saxatilis]|uniref:mucin-22-like isoform X2 n=1 Tax=Littorina saxatilis TaxID=31220 RepID=UPI0038B453DD